MIKRTALSLASEPLYGFADAIKSLQSYALGRILMIRRDIHSDPRIPIFEGRGVLLPNRSKDVLGDPTNAVLNGARDIVTLWLQEKFGKPVLERLQNGASFSYTDDRQHHVLNVIASEDIWACRAIFSNSQGRPLVTEVSLANVQKAQSPRVQFSVSQTTARAKGQDLTSVYPNFLGRLAAEYIMVDAGVQLASRLVVIKNSVQVNEVSKFIRGTGRSQPVIVFASPENARGNPTLTALETQFSQNILPVARQLAFASAGIAHVYLLSPGLDLILKRDLGELDCVTPGGTRLYPAFGIVSDNNITLSEASASSKNRVPFAADLFVRTMTASCDPNSTQQVFSPFSIAYRKTAAKNIAEPVGNAAVDLNDIFEQLVLISERLQEITAAQARGSSQSADELSAELKGYLGQLQALNTFGPNHEMAPLFDEAIGRAEDMRKAFVATSYGIVTPYEDKYEAMSAWVAQHYADQVILADSVKAAFANPKTAKYQDINLVYAVVELMATHYHQMKTSKGKSADLHRALFERRLEALHVEDSRSAKLSTLRERADEYTVTIDGERHLLGRHIKRSKDPDPVRHLRVYYAWDDKRKRVVIGAFGHLDNKLTN